MSIQNDIILADEADAWYLRNKDKINSKEDYTNIEVFSRYIKEGESFLEVGCCTGNNLNFLGKNKKINLYGLEPSKKAIEEGKILFPKIHFKHGTVESILSLDKKFDHILLGFFMYMVDLGSMPKVIGLIDQALKSKGYLHIVDFDSKYPVIKNYDHNSQMKMQKMNFSELFSVFPSYFVVEKKSWSHRLNSFDPDPYERCSSVTLYKEL